MSVRTKEPTVLVLSSVEVRRRLGGLVRLLSKEKLDVVFISRRHRLVAAMIPPESVTMTFLRHHHMHLIRQGAAFPQERADLGVAQLQAELASWLDSIAKGGVGAVAVWNRSVEAPTIRALLVPPHRSIEKLLDKNSRSRQTELLRSLLPLAPRTD